MMLPQFFCTAYSVCAKQQASCPAGTVPFEAGEGARIANQPALTGALSKKLQTLYSIVSKVQEEDDKGLLSRQV